MYAVLKDFSADMLVGTGHEGRWVVLNHNYTERYTLVVECEPPPF